MNDEHCKDCCCAKSWEALGITEYTGRSIPEEIQKIRREAAEYVIYVNDCHSEFCDNLRDCDPSMSPDPTITGVVEQIMFNLGGKLDAYALACDEKDAEIAELREQLRKQTRSLCTHCGKLFPKGSEGLEAFRDHISECNSHPLHPMAVQIQKLKEELLQCYTWLDNI